MEELSKSKVLEMISRFNDGQINRLKILDLLICIAEIDDVAIKNLIKGIFADCSKVLRKAGKPRTVSVEEVLIRRIGGDTQQKIAVDMGISISTVYRIVKANKELEQKMRKEILGE